ncbi:uncharacterized protein LOC135695965 isoform X3 [Rhopilema esculentum]
MKNERQPTEQKVKRLGAKNMELVQTNRRQETRLVEQQEEILSLKAKLKTYDEVFHRKDKEISKLKTKVQVKNEIENQQEEIETLQEAVQEQLQIIYDLRQQAVEKDRRIGVLRERMQKKQSRRNRKDRGRKSTSPDSLESISMEEDGFSTTSESINDVNGNDLEVSFDSDGRKHVENENYNQLMKERMEMERAYALLQQQVGGHLDPERTQLQIDAIQSDLIVAQAKIQDLEWQLEEAQKDAQEVKLQRPGKFVDDFKEERERLRNTNKVLHEKLIGAESEALSKTLEIKRLSQDLADVEEQRDLLEFRVAELEEKTRAKSPEFESWQLTDDDKLNLNQESEEIDFDAVSIRIALKELEINKQSVFSRKEKNTVIKAMDFIEKEEKELRSYESSEQRLLKRVSDLEGKYNSLKTKIGEKDNELAMLRAEKSKSEEQKLISTDEAFDGEAEEMENDCNHVADDPVVALDKALQKITDMEMKNSLLKQKLDRYVNEKKAELSEDDLEVLRKKVEELEEVKTRLKEMEKANAELEYQIEEVRIQKKAKDIIGDVMYNLPHSLEAEIQSLDEEKKLLSAELEELRTSSKEIQPLARKTEIQVKEERSTQTDSVDDTPWHKYMSPRSERSLSRNDSGLTPRSQVDEATQMPRVREPTQKPDKIAFEEHLKSAPHHKVSDDFDFDIIPSADDKYVSNLTESSIKTEMFNSSVESLFQFVDRILEEATIRAKETIKEEYSMVSPTLQSPDNDPAGFHLANGPGEMLDIYLEHYNKVQKSPINKGHSSVENYRSEDARNSPEYVEVDIPEIRNSSTCFSPDFEFDPLQIETSSVDENSCPRQSPPEGSINLLAAHTISCEHEEYRLNLGVDGSRVEDSDSRNTEEIKSALPKNSQVPDIADSRRVQHNRTQSSQSVASDDVNELLAYGALLRQGNDNNVSDSPAEVTLVKEPEAVCVDYDESFAVENSTAETSGDLTITNINVDNEALSKSGTSVPEKGESHRMVDFYRKLPVPNYDCQRLESSRSFDDSLVFNASNIDADSDFPSRLNLTDDGSYLSNSERCSPSPRGRACRPRSVPTTYCQFLSTPSARQKRRQSRFISSPFLDDGDGTREQEMYRSRSFSPSSSKRLSDRKRLRSWSAGEVLSADRKSGGNKPPTALELWDSEAKENHLLSSNRHSSIKRSKSNPVMYEGIQSKAERSQIGTRRAFPPPPVMPKPSTKSQLQRQTDLQTSDRSRKGVWDESDALRKELSMMKEECASLERQIQNKDTIMRTMKAELKEEVENIALLEKKEKMIQEKAESNAQLTQELQRCQKELEARKGEINRKDLEISQLKSEVRNLEISKKQTEQNFTEVQVQVTEFQVIQEKLADVQEEHDNVMLKNRELIERIKHLEIAEKDFIDLERNVIDLQEQLRDMEDIEAHRDDLLSKFQNLKRQRDEFLEKGRMVEEERNDFLRTNQTMEQRLEEFKKKYNNMRKQNGDLNRTILVLEREKKDLEQKILDIQNDRNIMQTALGKLEVERDDWVREVKEVTSERNILEQKLTEMDDMLSDHDHLEEGFHSLRLKLAEITRQRDDAEMLIPSLKAKIALLKKSCREKDETVTRYMEELKQFKHHMVGTKGSVVKGRVYEPVPQHDSRNRNTSSYFTKSRREESFATKGHKVDYNLSDESVVLSEDDRTITDDGSLADYRGQSDRRYLTSNRTVHVYDKSIRPSGRRRTYKALYDYDPYKSSGSEHPERELHLKEGDYITVYGEMDVAGYLEAEVDGETGLIPSIYVEEMSDDGNFASRRNETREVTSSGSYGARQRKFVCVYDYDPYTMNRGGRPDQQLSLRKGDVITVIGDVDIDGYYSAELNGRNGLVPATYVRQIGATNTGSTNFGSSSYGGQKTYDYQTTKSSEYKKSSDGRSGSIDIIRDDVEGPPFPPTNLKVSRIVGKDSLILTWKMPRIDKNGKSNGALVTGYKIWVNGKPVQDVKKYLMTKALVSGLNLRDNLQFDIQTVAENGLCSEKCHYNIYGADSLRNPDYEDFFVKAAGNYRTFIALFDYDPYKSSPNQNPALELQFSEGDLLKVYDTSRSDGFYHAEVRGKKGLVPSNFIEEISMPENSYSTTSNMYSSRGGSESFSRSMQTGRSSYGQTSSSSQQQGQEYEKRSSLSSTNNGRRRKMVAVYDYDPLKQSPSKDKSKELNLKKGQYVTVVGDMRPDGFYFGEADGRQGLVPGDFLEPSKDDDMDSRRVQFAAGDK